LLLNCKLIWRCSKSNSAGGHREIDRNRRDKFASQPKRDSSPPPVKRTRRDGWVLVLFLYIRWV